VPFDAAVYSWSSLKVSVVSIGLAIVVGFLDVPGSDLGVVILTFHACAGIGVGAFIGNQRAADIGAGLLLIALVQTFGSNDVTRSSLESLGWLPQRPILIAFIAHSLICAALRPWPGIVMRGTGPSGDGNPFGTA
jgi:hypothetical protein